MESFELLLFMNCFNLCDFLAHLLFEFLLIFVFILSKLLIDVNRKIILLLVLSSIVTASDKSKFRIIHRLDSAFLTTFHLNTEMWLSL